MAISGEDDGEVAASADPNNVDSKKATEWFLEPWALQDGVQSTTRYRKDNTGRRSGGSHRSAGASSRKKHGSHHHITSNGGVGGRIRSRHHLSSASSGLMHYNPHHLASLHHPHPRPTLVMPPLAPSYHEYQQQHHHEYQHHEQPQQLQPAMFPSEPYRPLYSAQAPSESGADEPVTPEASFSEGLPLPDLHGRTALSSNNSAQAVAAAYYGAAGEGAIGGVDMAGYTYPSAAAPVVSVYEDVVDRYGGWPGVGSVEETTSAAGYHGHHGQGQY